GSQGDQLIDVLGLQRFGFKTKTPSKEFSALSNISLEVPRGHRIGIIGRNGAGKTTLLKLICGNFAPTSGEVAVHGTVQALMNIGLGFHPEYTGRENVEASLQYNGLARDEYHKAIEGIVEFCELGDFLDQPFKTYSLGMQARLMFATATAIKPDILIVDEVLGAGDAYFVAKSKARVEKLVHSGCTMLLVSHSMQQVLELCDEAIWLDQGRIRMQGDAFLVVKAYEEYLHGPVMQILRPNLTTKTNLFDIVSIKSTISEVIPEEFSPMSKSSPIGLPSHVLLQEPYFLQHGHTPGLPENKVCGFHFEAPGGISRWDSEPGLKIIGFSVVTTQGMTNSLIAMQPAKFIINLVAEHDGFFNCCYGIALHDQLGNCVTRLFSPNDKFEIDEGKFRQVEILLNPCQIGPGEYTLGISVTEHTEIERINDARRFDLLNRSFSIRVELPSSLSAASALFFHSAEWSFNT
ncbi:MAG: ABC transporter ATP-binding protein, partial [Acinetobacter sp.]|nr:ABC transporter ATP-binding protein [Acinetobacter sp.]